jgi:hypothetical protein
VKLITAEFACLQQSALDTRRYCDPRSQKSPDTQLDGFPVPASDDQAPTGKAHLWAFRSRQTTVVIKSDSEEASIVRRELSPTAKSFVLLVVRMGVLIGGWNHDELNPGGGRSLLRSIACTTVAEPDQSC